MDLEPIWIKPLRTAHDQWVIPRGCFLVDLTDMPDAMMKARMCFALATEAGVIAGKVGDA